MTPSELRELADALAKGTHFVDSPELHAAMQSAADYLRACADEKPMAWIKTTHAGVRRLEWAEQTHYANEDYPAKVEPLYLRPAPAAPKEHPCNSARNLS